MSVLPGREVAPVLQAASADETPGAYSPGNATLRVQRRAGCVPVNYPALKGGASCFMDNTC
uniref:hypothetical protein n=1 Tax=Methanoculleus sp. TaxID=90427 RepID=UPI0025F43B0B